jgi:hypothetical protein
MRSVLFLGTMAAVTLLVTAPSASAAPMSVGPDRPATSVQVVRAPQNAAHFTEGQCVGLGGKVAETVICGSGKACVMADQNGVVHKRCLTKE